jgi:hypothetical protein
LYGIFGIVLILKGLYFIVGKGSIS